MADDLYLSRGKKGGGRMAEAELNHQTVHSCGFCALIRIFLFVTRGNESEIEKSGRIIG